MTERKFGWFKDPPKQPDEPPDRSSSRLLGAVALPRAASLEQHILSILDQGPYNSCVANTAAQCVRARHSALGVPQPTLLSRWWAYYLARASHGAELKDEGTYIRACFGALRKFGFPTEAQWPYNPAHDGRPMFTCHPPVRVFWDAADQRSPLAYYRITAVGEARVRVVKQAIASGYCVAFGTLVTQAFVEGTTRGFVGLPGPQDTIVGGHAMTLAAYDERGFSGPNSWGEQWGDRGWFHFKSEVIAWEKSSDFWIVENVPKFLAP